MKNIISILIFLSSLTVVGQISSVQKGLYKGDSIHNRTTIVKAFIDATNVLKANPGLEYTVIKPYDSIVVYANDIFTTNTYTVDSTYHIKLVSHVGVDRAVILFESEDSFTAENGTRAPLDVWLDLPLRLYIEEINGKEYIVKIEIQ